MEKKFTDRKESFHIDPRIILEFSLEGIKRAKLKLGLLLENKDWQINFIKKEPVLKANSDLQ